MRTSLGMHEPSDPLPEASPMYGPYRYAAASIASTLLVWAASSGVATAQDFDLRLDARVQYTDNLFRYSDLQLRLFEQGMIRPRHTKSRRSSSSKASRIFTPSLKNMARK